MIARVAAALVFASIITFGMFLGMSEVAEWFNRRDPAQYFRVDDFLPADTGGRPRQFIPPRQQPPRAPVTGADAETVLPELAPSFTDESAERVEPPAPAIEPPPAP